MVYAQHIIIGHWHFGIMGPRNRTITYTTVRDPITNLGVAHTRGARIVHERPKENAAKKIYIFIYIL